MADDSDRAAALAEAYKRDILPPDMKAAYEEAMKRGLVAKTPSKYAKSQDAQRKDDPDHPKWDVVGDIGRAAKGAIKATGDSLSKAFPSAQESAATDAANREKYGAVLGTAKSALVDPFSRAGSAAMAPLNALGVLGSPVTGAAHALGGSALSYLPGMDKQAGDEAVDTMMMGIGPEGGMAGGPIAAGQRANALRAAATQTAKAGTASQNAATIAKNQAFVDARNAGYVVHPADAVEEPGAVGNALAGLGGKIKTQQAASVKNQQVTNQIAAKELGLPPSTSLDEAAFKTVRAKAGQAYQVIENAAQNLPRGAVIADKDYKDAIAGLDTAGHELRRDFPELAKNPDIASLQASLSKGEFSPKAAIEAIKRLRFQAKANLKSFDDPVKKELGMAQRQASDAIEDLVDRNVSATGNTAAVTQYRAARQLIAKSHDIEAVTDARGNVDARKLAALGSKRPLSGNLKVIADTAESFPKSMQNPDKFGGLEKRSVLDTGAMIASGVGALATHNPYLALGALAPLGRPVARSLALSDFLQNRLMGLRSAPTGAGAAVRQGLPPAMAGQNYLRSMGQQGQPLMMGPGVGAAAQGPQPLPQPPPAPQQGQ